MKILNNVQGDELVDKWCFYCPNALKGKALDDDFPLYEYTCKLKNKILEDDLIIPDWCPLEDYTEEDIS